MVARNYEDCQAELVLIELTHPTSTLKPDIKAILEILLQDFLACSVSGKRKYVSNANKFPEGLTQRAIRLGLYGSADDQDDINWSTLSHNGTIIWATAIAAGLENNQPIEKLKLAAAHGYRTGSTIAKLFGSTHRSHWHVTATSGAFASTSTAAIIFGLTPEQHLAALKLCAINLGGLNQAVFERGGATRFNRGAAISLGLTSVQAALMGSPHVQDIWNPPRGLFENFSLAPEIFIASSKKCAKDFIVDGVTHTSLRLFPCTGFAQAAALATYKLRQLLPGVISSITVELSQVIMHLSDGSLGGVWWDPKAIVSAIAFSKNPMEISEPEHLINKVNLIFTDIPIGGAKVTLKSESVIETMLCINAPGSEFFTAQETKWRDHKWNKMLGDNFKNISSISIDLATIEQLLFYD